MLKFIDDIQYWVITETTEPRISNKILAAEPIIKERIWNPRIPFHYRFYLMNEIAQVNDQATLIKQFFKFLNLDRINITLPEAIDLLFYIMSGFARDVQSIVKKAKRGSILSSLNYDQLKQFIGPEYLGFADYPSMLYAGLIGNYLDRIYFNVPDEPWPLSIVPLDFNPIRYANVKQFDLAKTLNIQRVYGQAYNDVYYPPYLSVACHPPNEELERLYREVNQDNYINILNQLGIKTNDNPTYFVALARMTVIVGSLRWVNGISNESASEILGIPLEIIKEIRNKSTNYGYYGEDAVFVNYLRPQN